MAADHFVQLYPTESDNDDDEHPVGPLHSRVSAPTTPPQSLQPFNHNEYKESLSLSSDTSNEYKCSIGPLSSRLSPPPPKFEQPGADLRGFVLPSQNFQSKYALILQNKPNKDCIKYIILDADNKEKQITSPNWNIFHDVINMYNDNTVSIDVKTNVIQNLTAIQIVQLLNIVYIRCKQENN